MLGIIAVVVAATWRLRTLREADGRVTGPASKRRDAKAATTALQQACTANNPIAATRALMEMARVHWPEDPPSGLQQIADRLVLGKEAIAGLERAVYGANASAWDGSALWQALGRGLADKTARPPRAIEQTELPVLEPLYR
jgi:hypothetical protein